MLDERYEERKKKERERYHANKERASELRKLRYAANKDEILAKNRQRYHNNKEEYAIRNKRHRDANKERQVERSRLWYLSNRGAVTAKVLARERYVKMVTPLWASVAEINKIYAGCPVGHHVDHIIPLKGIDPVTREHVVCGLHVENNLGYLPASENGSKWAWFRVDE